MKQTLPDLEPYERRLERPTNLKLPDLQHGPRPKHILFAQQFDRPFLDRLGRTADQIRVLSQTKATAVELRDLLPHKRAMLYFTQQSTRTFLSFMASCQLLGMSVAEIRDPSLSSEYKGESPLDSMRMFSSYSDLIVIRDKLPQFAEACAYLMNDLDDFNQRSVPIVNGGSGADEHPTQALLDIFTIQRTFGIGAAEDHAGVSRFAELQSRHPDLQSGLDGKTYVFSGDIGRGRTVRSLCVLLANFDNIHIRFVSPAHSKLRLQADLRDWLKSRHIDISEHSSLDEVIEEADIVYSTRIQSEHDRSESDVASAEDLRACHVTPERVQRMKEYGAVLHPFPRNEEIPAAVDNDPRAMYFRQARNGIWIRAAAIAHLFDVDTSIREIYDSHLLDWRRYNQDVL